MGVSYDHTERQYMLFTVYFECLGFYENNVEHALAAFLLVLSSLLLSLHHFSTIFLVKVLSTMCCEFFLGLLKGVSKVDVI